MPRSFPGARLEHIRCEERSLSQRPGMPLEAGAGSSAAGPRPARRHPGGVTVDPGFRRAPQEREARPTGLLRSLEVGAARAGSVTCLARRPLGVRGLNDAVEWPLIHVIQAVECANRVGIRERSGLPAGCRARHTRRPRRTSDFTCESGPPAQACEGKRANHRAERLPHVLLPPIVVSAERAANCRTWRLTGNATRPASSRQGGISIFEAVEQTPQRRSSRERRPSCCAQTHDRWLLGAAGSHHPAREQRCCRANASSLGARHANGRLTFLPQCGLVAAVPAPRVVSGTVTEYDGASWEHAVAARGSRAHFTDGVTTWDRTNG
jgi:hypothetical protein